MMDAGDVQLGIDAALVALLSALFAWLAIRMMMSWLAKANFTIFVVYRLGLGVILLLGLQLGWIVHGLAYLRNKPPGRYRAR